MTDLTESERADLEEGLRQSAAGETVSLGSFAQYAEEPQRDQWGETAEERRNRIFARDLARLAFSEQMARDGVPIAGSEVVAFNAGYAAGRADYLNVEGSPS